MLKAAPIYEGLSVTFNTTEECNLRCKYCYEINKTPRTLQLETAYKFIDKLLEDPDPIDSKGDSSTEWILESGLIMDFLGGDALMNPYQLDKILSYFMFQANTKKHKWANRWRASVSTNGTLFQNPGVKEFCEKYIHNLSLGVSIDGSPKIHDLNRIFADGRGSMDIIMRDWKWYVDYCKRAGYFPQIKATLNAQSIPYLYESLVFLHETLDLSFINMNFAMENIGTTDWDVIVFDREMARCVDYVLKRRHAIYWSMLAESAMGEEATEEMKKKSRCGSGAMPALSLNGKIYPCFRFLPHTTINSEQDMCVGDVDSGFVLKNNFCKVREGGKPAYNSDAECLACPIETACPYCIGGCYSEFGKFKRTKYICELAKVQDKWAKIYWREYDKLEGTQHVRAYKPTWFEYNNLTQPI